MLLRSSAGGPPAVPSGSGRLVIGISLADSMVVVTGDALPAHVREVVGVVLELLTPHGPDCAGVTHAWSERAGMWFIEVVPRTKNAAAVSIGLSGNDELLVQFGRTRIELWDSKRGPTPLDQLQQLLPAVFGGRFEEAGSDGFARVELPRGQTARLGAAHLPLPWAWRRRRQYQSYS